MKGGALNQFYKKHQFIGQFVLFLFLLSAAEGCKSQLCCVKYGPQTDEATYCNNHRSAVGTFVRQAAPDTTKMLDRLNNFKTFYKTIEGCETVDCIGNQIENATTLPGFAERYKTEHDFAEKDTQINADMKAKLILCGFKHAMDALDQTINKDRN